MAINEIKERTLQFLHDLWIDDTAQTMHILRSATAAGFGFEPKEFSRPFPGSAVNVNLQQRVASGLAKTAMALVTGAGLTAGAMALLSKPEAAQPPPATANVWTDEYRARVFWGDEEILPNKPAHGSVTAEE
jgi:hypothetical protein